MYNLAAPIIMGTLTDEALPIYTKQIIQSKIDRIFIGTEGYIYEENSFINNGLQRLGKLIDYFKTIVPDVGVWISAFGHGDCMIISNSPSHETKTSFTPIEGINGDTMQNANCPLDENFKKVYLDGIKKIAELKPDLIMLDDDFRLNGREIYFGCFCEKHLSQYYKKIGEEIPRNKIEKYILNGGKNKYRSGYMELMAQTLLNFATETRKAVDEIDENIRLGYCVCYDNIDLLGIDATDIAKAFAGKTKPFMRTIGAPYWTDDIIDVIEDTRMQAAWWKKSDVEIFAEGDTFPRPRYKVAAKLLELFDFAISADGNTDGILKYIFNYTNSPHYETGYVEAHIRNMETRKCIADFFDGKKPSGLWVFNAQHKIENLEISDNTANKAINKLISSYRSVSRNILSKNSIPTSYEMSDNSVFLIGENAKYIDTDALKNGVVADISAAVILQKRGIDTGLLASKKCSFSGEYFIKDDDAIFNLQTDATYKIKVSEDAEILSIFKPDNTPAAYYYENKDGIRFYIMAYDIYNSPDYSPWDEHHFFHHEQIYANYAQNYYRQQQLIKAAEWTSGKKLPAVSLKHPGMYIMTSESKDSMAVLIINISMDDVIKPEILLDKEYHSIKCVNCTGTLKDNKVILSDTAAYGYALFEVSL